MSKSEQNTFECSDCGNDITTEDEFCPECGALFEESVNCTVHADIDAAGVCIICCHAFCEKCGARENNRFLCNEHYHYEIYQGMARIYGSLDDTEIQYMKSCIEQEGFHPVIFSRTQPMGGSRLLNNLYEANGDSKGHIVNEIKLMVPCQEVIAAVEILGKLKHIN